MASYNRVVLVGNITRDIELKYTQGGTAVTEITIAVNDRRKSASGEWVEETTFVDVTLWGRTAEVASEYLSKGSPILVEGRLKLDMWETDGQKRSKLRVIGERMQMLSGGGGGGGGESRQRSQPQRRDTVQENSYDSHDYQDSHTSRDTQSRPAGNPAGQREAQPTGNGPGYDDPDIPF
ncbi:single-strand binding protein [Rhodopirellula maiorica SM1]|uniref:Single-stranded DNA-binding protein n=1 Tax=Rhodopirellula maiorica SM1 TaxID=1265738 RepID=M5RPS1_9BACT|nr:single-stranded DNA-binding protein [Rhodopirellula maiorica]EMI21280.1 single-strand binding protein [Rhodopirellula maiorica SM1]